MLGCVQRMTIYDRDDGDIGYGAIKERKKAKILPVLKTIYWRKQLKTIERTIRSCLYKARTLCAHLT
ncbi:hypothetical protein B6N13_03510 [Marinomonas sp. UCMA 3892]|nr:hypothetical protein [Marinomonas sp. UCMA 3892]